MNILRLLFSFNGRINRARYWLGWVIIYAFVAAWTTLGALLPRNETVSFIGGIVGLGCVVSLLAILAKRLHDLSLSGWWTQAPMLLFVPFFVLSTSYDDARYTLGVGFVYLAVAGLSVIWLGCAKGMIGPNRYGPDPLGRQLA
jgi:uncharacterized membrane protein YhaH (DUF805 family)